MVNPDACPCPVTASLDPDSGWWAGAAASGFTGHNITRGTTVTETIRRDGKPARVRPKATTPASKVKPTPHLPENLVAKLSRTGE
jgi:hypothetical protein